MHSKRLKAFSGELFINFKEVTNSDLLQNRNLLTPMHLFLAPLECRPFYGPSVQDSCHSLLHPLNAFKMTASEVLLQPREQPKAMGTRFGPY